MKWFKVSDSGNTNIVLIKDGEVYSADQNHPRFDDIEYQLEEDDEEGIEELFNFGKRVDEFFQVTSRVSLRGSTLFFDDKPVDNVLANHVVKSIKEGLDDHMPFVRFWEKVESNKSEHSREQLLDWLMASDFTITETGDILGYKGVTQNLTSLTAGPGVVNGEAVTGNLDNSVGNVVEVARSYVTWDPEIGCAEGLHVGTWDYAHGFGPRTMEVHVDPADVVSVPTDCNSQKMRVCKYVVVRELDTNYSLGVLSSPKTVTRQGVEFEVEDDDEEFDW